MEDMQKKLRKSLKVMQTVNNALSNKKKLLAVDSINYEEKGVMRKIERIRRQVERLNGELLLFLKEGLKSCLIDDDKVKQMKIKVVDKCLQALQLARDILASEKGYGYEPKTVNLVEMVQEASENIIIKAIQQLKDTSNWIPSMFEASQALIWAFISERNDICHLLITEGVTLDMSDIPEIVHKGNDNVIFNVIQHLKNISRWEPGDVWCSEAFILACENVKYSACNLLIQESVILDMFVFCEIIEKAPETVIISLLQHLKETNKWMSQSAEASEALQLAFIFEKKNICESLIKEGVELDQQHITTIIRTSTGTVICRVIQYLKEKNRWNHMCWDTVKILLWAFENEKSDTCEILIQEGVQLEMCLLDELSIRASINVIIKVIQHLIDQKHWNPQSSAASVVLERACNNSQHDLCEFLIKGGVKVELSYLPDIVKKAPMNTVTKIAEHLKNRNELYNASEILKWAFIFDRMDICNQLLQVGIVIKMCQFPKVAEKAPLNAIIKVIEYFKDTGRWNPHLQTAIDALRQAFACEKNEICNLLIKEGIVLKMHDFYELVRDAPIKPILKVVQHLKENMTWRTDVLALDALDLFKTHRGLEISQMLQREGIHLQAWDHKYKRKIPKVGRMMENILFLTNVKLINCLYLDAGEVFEINQQMHGGFTPKEKEVLSIIASHQSIHCRK